jgi:F-type H+-transporting ATPase subunit b
LLRQNRTRSPRLVAGATALASVGILAAGRASASGDSIVLWPEFPMLPVLMLLFIALIFPVNALLFRPIFNVLDAREAKIAGTRARAEKLTAEADEVLERYQGEVRAAREEAERERRAMLAAAKSEASAQLAAARGGVEREIERARGEISSELTAARSTLRRAAESLAREASARILGRHLS